MYVDIPKLTRCCCCLPLRRGILAFAYLNLILAILSVAGISYTINSYGIWQRGYDYYYSRCNYFYSNAIFLLLVVLLDVVFHIVLIVGAHRKNVRLMKVYYYYGISTTVAVFLLGTALMFSPGVVLLQIVMVLFVTVFHSYLILLVRSEIVKLEASSQPRQYVNRLTDIVVSNQPRQDTKNLIADF